MTRSPSRALPCACRSKPPTYALRPDVYRTKSQSSFQPTGSFLIGSPNAICVYEHLATATSCLNSNPHRGPRRKLDFPSPSDYTLLEKLVCLDPPLYVVGTNLYVVALASTAPPSLTSTSATVSAVSRFLPSIRNDPMGSQSARRCSVRTSTTRPSSLHRAHQHVIDLHHSNDASRSSLQLASSVPHVVLLPCVARYFFASPRLRARTMQPAQDNARSTHATAIQRCSAESWRQHTTQPQDTTDPTERARPNTKQKRAERNQYNTTQPNTGETATDHPPYWPRSTTTTPT